MTTFLVTGGAGFIGSHIVEEILRYEDTHVIVLDCLTYAGRLDRLAHLDRKRIKYIYCDFSQPIDDNIHHQLPNDIEYIIHNGAASHVVRSFQEPRTFVNSNIMGTLHVLEMARVLEPERMIYISTDEVFGGTSIPQQEDNALAPTNPYAATKASGELLAYSYFRSFGLPVIITRTMNIFGERQHPEKFIPKITRQILREETVQIHGVLDNGIFLPCERHWLHASNQANAMLFLLKNGIPGEKYNIEGFPVSNMEMFQLIARILGKSDAPWCWAPPIGPIHDMSYSLKADKIKQLGWKPPIEFQAALEKTIQWTAANPQWLEE